MMRKLTVVRQTLLGLLVVFGFVALAIYPQTAAAISLKGNSVVTGNTITLGDIFEGLPSGHDKVMGIAPAPGQQMVLDSRTLLRIAMALDLPWRPETTGDTVVLKRAATLVDKDTIEAALHSSLAEKGVTGEYKLVLADTMQDMILPQDMAPAVEVSAIDIKPQNNWFEATLAAPSKDKPLTTQRITGRIEYMTKIPVLRESMSTGTVIGKNDIDFIDIPQRNIKAGMVLNADDLDGMTPRRVLIAGQSINAGDLESPRMVERGETVTMIFNASGLQLTAQGKALENGAKGDRIRIVNTASNKTVVAEVTNDKEVTLKEF
jgi:flagella basal body P-ring formation protein FlgA